jgi:cation:H+ antiporter
MITYILLGVGLAILLAGGKLLVDGASGMALKLGLSPGLVGLTIVAMGTSAPELLVSISAALKGNSDIAIGNVVGSNIANISLVLGIAALLFPIIIHRSILKIDYLFTFLSAVLFYGLAFNNIISRLEGILLFILLIALNIFFFKKIKPTEDGIESSDDPELKPMAIPKSIFFIVFGVAGLYFGSELFVSNAVIISKTFGISERVIGITVIAIGTSLPELITSILAALNKKTDIAIGNILGSNMMNILAIIGITAIVQPIPVSELFLQKDFLWMLGITAILFPIILTKGKIGRMEGAFLLGIYGVYLYTLL